jgi:hypothetical protein
MYMLFQILRIQNLGACFFLYFLVQVVEEIFNRLFFESLPVNVIVMEENL